MRFGVFCGAWLLAIVGVGAQAPPAPAFEAASIRPSAADRDFTLIRQNTGGRFVAESITVSNLIQQAYRLFNFQIVGGPEWIARERFDIQATAPGTTPAQQGALLQQLLADRFALRVRQEQREMDVYALVIARPDGRLGPNLKPFTGECRPPDQPPRCTMRNGPTFTDALGMPFSLIVGQVTGNVQRIVVDKTGLTGRFDFKYEWTNEPPNVNAADGKVSFITALQEQLGLKLETHKAPVDVLVVEEIQRPTAN
jgi:uncharacterized protein (TIGR03435 family)